MSFFNLKEKSQLRKFGISIGIILLIVVLYEWFFKEKLLLWLLGLSVSLMVAGVFIPQILKWLYRPWMWLAEKIGYVMNRVILTIFYFLILTPIALIRRLFNRDPLSLKWDKKCSSYFESKSTQPIIFFKNLF